METGRGEVERLDRILLAVTISVMAPLAVFTVAAAYLYAEAGLPFGFFVWLVAVVLWSKIVKYWLDKRFELGRASEQSQALREEIERLRESIEALRRSLES